MRSRLSKSLQRSSSRLYRREEGFSLIEVAVAGTILAVACVGLASVLFRAHELGTINRHRDQARAVIKSFADQFTRLQVADTDSSHNVVTRTFFTDTTAPTGLGLNFNSTAGTSSELDITLGDAATGQVSAKVTREVAELDESAGTTNTDAANTAAGRMIQGTFTITYTVNSRIFTQTVVVCRSVK